MVKIHAPRLLVATHNKGKLGEYIDILTERWSDLLTLDEAGIVALERAQPSVGLVWQEIDLDRVPVPPIG